MAGLGGTAWTWSMERVFFSSKLTPFTTPFIARVFSPMAN